MSSAWKLVGLAEKAAEGKESLQLINAEGELDMAGLEAFSKHIKLADCGLSYAVVAIMGPQSSGKSTLLNHLFDTEFTEMDALSGRSQTTQGVWLSRAAGLSPCTIVMDLEGTDGRERGEDDTAFEKQSALFALAVSDIVIINMWCHDIGREQAANKPLLKTVFQVMVRLFTPRKTTLLFAIRDKTRTPMDVLEPILREDIAKIWDSVPKPQAFDGVKLSDCFNVKVASLSNYEEKPEVFKDQVADLRERFRNSIAPGGLAGDRRAVVPGTAFSVSSSSIWKVIKENKDLDLPAHKVMVATVRCEEIANEKLTEFQQNEEWVSVNENSKTGVVNGFGLKLNALLDKYTSEYDQEVSYFDENVRAAKRNYLVQEVLEIVHPAYQRIITHNRVGAIESFRKDVKGWADTADSGDDFASTVRQCSENVLSDFDKGVVDAKISYAEWDAAKLREKLRRDIDSHAAAVRSEKIDAIVSDANKHLEAGLAEPTAALLESATPDTWAAIRDLLAHEREQAQASLLSALSGYELDETEEKAVLEGMVKHGRTTIENAARKEASQALLRMKDRFTTSFSHDAEAMPRVWSLKDDVRAVARDARSTSLKGLAVLAAIRLDDNSSDRVEISLVTLLRETHDGSLSKSSSLNPDGEVSSISKSSNPLAATSWEGVRADQTLLSPSQCKVIWRQFKAETDYAIRQALANQEASRKGSSWLPPPWAIVAMIVLGFNEFVTLLRNPLYLLIVFVVYLLGKALWIQLDVSAEFRHGIVPGLLGVSSKIVPTIMNFLTKLAQEGSRVGETNPSSSNGSSETTSTLNRASEELQHLVFNKTGKSDGFGVRSRQPAKRSVDLDT